MKLHPYRRKKGATGSVAFTLVEVLVAEAVFLILMLVVVQLIFGVIQTAAAQKKRMDSLDDARQSLDRLSLDWAGRVRRTDVAGAFSRQTATAQNAANAQIGFLTQAQAYAGARHLSWVSYGVTNVTQVNQGSQSTTTPAMVRGIIGYNWSSGDSNPTGTAASALTFPAGTTAPSITGTPTVESLANTVFRVEYCFVQQVPATLPPATTTSAFTTNSLALNSSNLVGVVVAVAALDQQSRQILTQSQMVALGNALPSVTDGQSPQVVWTTSINNGSFASNAAAAGVPASVASAVRVFQRVLYLNE
jgi:type II secretory pathway pseudopilin PulG